MMPTLMQGAMTPLTSFPTTSVVPRPKGHGITSMIATEFVPSGAHVSAKHSLLYGKGVTDSGFWRLSNSTKTSRRKRAGMCNVNASILQSDIFTTTKTDTDVLTGSLEVSNIHKASSALAARNNVFVDISDLKITLQLVSVELDPRTKDPKRSEKSNLTTVPGPVSAIRQSCTVTFNVPKDFGEVGAFEICNSNSNPEGFYFHYMTLDKPSDVQFLCNSWVYNEINYSEQRVFFSNKTYLPSATPAGLVALRQADLNILRGHGATGEKKDLERIYDYDIYNDLSPSTERNPLGGSEFPYPRRIKTGRDRYGKILTHPRDEDFSPVKLDGIYIGGFKSEIRDRIDKRFGRDNWNSFDDITTSFFGHDLCPKPWYKRIGTTLMKFIGLKHPLPQLLKGCTGNKCMAWMTDEEFGRQTLAGVNPSVIALLKEFPPTSSPDLKVYGQATALTELHIEPYLEGKTVTEAIDLKRLFTVDYHDIFLPYINRINALPSNKGYAPRSIFYYTDAGKMMPVAIELSVLSADRKSVHRVLTPPRTPESDDHTWMLAKLHATTTDFNYHEIYSHFTRAHGAMEPIIIASNRQLSKLHPIFTYLLPLLKDTMNINSFARERLINADGIIERTATPGKYSMEMASTVYDKVWRLDHEAFPEDLIARGMAERNGDAVKLVIEDYPFAADGLEIWDAIKTYTSKYVNIVYQGADQAVQSDTELENWWNEIINKGHEDKKNEPWWPKLNSVANLVEVLTTISWIAGPHHAAHNFGQHAYGGFLPNKPFQTQKLIPEKGTAEYDELQAKPEKYWLSAISSKANSVELMKIFELLSTHSDDEEYIGKRNNDNWTSDSQVREAFREFSRTIEELELNQKDRNKDSKLFNRIGPAEIPYTLLCPSSESGLTGKGVPNSISI